MWFWNCRCNLNNAVLANYWFLILLSISIVLNFIFSQYVREMGTKIRNWTLDDVNYCLWQTQVKFLLKTQQHDQNVLTQQLFDRYAVEWQKSITWSWKHTERKVMCWVLSSYHSCLCLFSVVEQQGGRVCDMIIRCRLTLVAWRCSCALAAWY